MGTTPDWPRKYPPLLAMLVALVIAVFVMPSALNLPQTNPEQTLEFAPVPPEDDDPPPPADGSLASLGLASSPGFAADEGQGPGQLPIPLEPDEILTKTPSTKRCVGDPPRQTEDPLSPPCVAFFDGDNFGETYQGVNAEEIRILFYIEGFTTYLTRSQGNESTPDQQMFDLWEPPADDEHVIVRVLRVWQRYFADRYQTYRRVPHFYVYFSGSDSSPEARRGDAIANFNAVEPFAVLNYARENADAYLETMARRGVLNFGSYLGRSESFFNQYPRMIWGYYPSLEQQARQYASFVCQKVVPHPVSFSGNNDHGEPRRLGIVYTTDEGQPQLRRYKDEVVRLIRACGGDIVAEGTFPSAGYAQDNRYPPRYAMATMVDFRDKGVTTILWPGGLETQQSRAAAQLNYYPEWIISGDQIIEGTSNNQLQDQEAWQHAWVVTNVVKEVGLDDSLCFQAYREADPNAPRTDAQDACNFYNDLRQLFIGIQVAGPRLGPTSIYRGFQAIPEIPSNDPRVPACFYLPDDYTCIKDAAAWWWDPTGQAPGGTGPGCWRLGDHGQRYLADGWPEGDVLTMRQPDNPCGGYVAPRIINPNPPSPENI